MPIAVIALMAAIVGTLMPRLSPAALSGLATGFLAAMLPGSATGPLRGLLGVPAGNTRAILWSHKGLGALAGAAGHAFQRAVQP